MEKWNVICRQWNKSVYCWLYYCIDRLLIGHLLKKHGTTITSLHFVEALDRENQAFLWTLWISLYYEISGNMPLNFPWKRIIGSEALSRCSVAATMLFLARGTVPAWWATTGSCSFRHKEGWPLTPYTCLAPALAANIERMPVPLPTSSTILSLKMCLLWYIEFLYVNVLTSSFSISCTQTDTQFSALQHNSCLCDRTRKH